jgi:hypothetical protein
MGAVGGGSVDTRAFCWSIKRIFANLPALGRLNKGQSGNPGGLLKSKPTWTDI